MGPQVHRNKTILTTANSGLQVKTHFLGYGLGAGIEMPNSNPDQMQKVFKSDISVLIGVLEKNLSISISLRTLTSNQLSLQMLLAGNQILKKYQLNCRSFGRQEDIEGGTNLQDLINVSHFHYLN